MSLVTKAINDSEEKIVLSADDKPLDGLLELLWLTNFWDARSQILAEDDDLVAFRALLVQIWDLRAGLQEQIGSRETVLVSDLEWLEEQMSFGTVYCAEE